MRPLLALATAVALGAGARSAAAQEPPDPLGQEPGADTVEATPAPVLVPPRLSLVVTVGTAAIGTLQTRPFRASLVALEAAPPWIARDTATLSRSLVVDGGFHAGASVVLSLTPTWAARLGGGVTRASLVEEFGGADDRFLEAARALVGTQDRPLQVLDVETALRFRIPSSRRVQPYLELGALATRWSTDGALPGAESLDGGVTRFGAMAAVGGTVALGERLSLALHASSRTLAAPLGGPVASEETEPRLALGLTALDEPGTAFSDSRREILGSTRLEVGLSLNLGQVGEADPDRSGSAGSP